MEQKLLTTKIPFDISIRIFAPANSKHWIWLGTTDNNNYATYFIEGKTQGVHRYLYKLLINYNLSNEYDLDHLCRIPPCINPECLEPVSTAENIHRGNVTKLTVGEVIEIRKLYKTGQYTHKILAQKYRVGRSTISNILCGLNWRGSGSIIPSQNQISLDVEKAYVLWRIKGIGAKKVGRILGVSEGIIRQRVLFYEKRMLNRLRKRGLIK